MLRVKGDMRMNILNDILDDCLMEIFEMSRIYVGNECIEMKVPERICGGENEYVKWCNELCLNL